MNGEDELPDEVEYLSGILTGDYTVNHWQSKKKRLISSLLKVSLIESLKS